MTPTVHKVYITTLVLVVVLVTLFLSIYGFQYYQTSLEERFYHEQHHWLKPSGIFGQGLGIIGSSLILIGVIMYMVRKRFRSLARFGALKYWLEFHIFLCTIGPIMVLFHTAFKFGGIVSISFWSMVAVVVSGIIGRFIYKQIPRTIQGNELEWKEMEEQFQVKLYELNAILPAERSLSISIERPDMNRSGVTAYWEQWRKDQARFSEFGRSLHSTTIDKESVRSAQSLFKHLLSLKRQMSFLSLMQRLFKYWHVAHLPFALIMLIIMLVHVAVTVELGYRWIF
ncbi:MAG TPA: hypothetical protein PK006_07430 [Saprospiraceae bacterium]|nr:hypothetical protein [Saprospiraceae bacterium]